MLQRCCLFYVLFLIIPFVSCSSSVRFSDEKKDSSLTADYSSYKDYSVLEQAEGVASYYGKKFHAKKTSSGEVYDMNGMTASHKVYPFGTIVRVTNLKNGLQTIVKINDRLPKKSKRVIDLSVKAAETLDFIKRGITKVRLEVLEWGGTKKQE